MMINLNSSDIMDAKETSEIWKTGIVTTQGMEAITGKQDPRKNKL
ncbi:MAG: hypothetical protein N4R78_01545 [Lactobacillus iners]|nr:hypothetical protein [Lactobacillus iners]